MLLRPENSLIFLVGFMASGKSTTGFFLAEALGLKFYDLDAEIETRIGKSIAKIFQDEGAIFFRQIEHETLKQLAQQKYAVISLGGGTIIEDRNLEIIKKHGVIVCLTAEIEELWERISDSEKSKLIVGNKSLNEEQIYQRIKLLLEVREPFYKQADLFIDTTHKTIENVVQEIILRLEAVWYKQL